ncbi:HAMP domain-containing histidine kinase [Flavobacteriaceae bacterium]|nr:HAMP domain-containing histidine kinase [Flavobacteriaceae bacterium]
MKSLDYISITLILFGAIILILAALKTRDVFDMLPKNMSKKNWRKLYLFMIFFACGYLIIILLIIYNSTNFLEVISGVIFFLGGLFVFSVVQTGLISIKEINKYIKKTELINNELKDFTYVASHQLKSPLRAISALATFIEEDIETKNTDEVNNHLKIIQNRAVYMERVIDDVLLYSKIEINTFNLVDLSKIIINEFNEYKDIRGIKFELLNKPPLIYGCHKQLTKVVKELIKNAVDYNQKPDKKVKIYYEESQKQINLYFEDNGPGIPEKYHSKIFNFFDIINEQNLNANSGVGLAIVKKIINIHNGGINIISDGKSGTIFKISFTK